jgi:hypothetical protein
MYIATTCLTYLSFNSFRSGTCSLEKELEQRLQQNDFLDYAAKPWGDHARAVETRVSSLACAFLLEDGLLSCATQVLSVRNNLFQGHSQSLSGGTNQHCTARFGLTQITDDLLWRIKEEPVNAVNTTDSLGRSPLFLAAGNGHDETTKLLLDKGADINKQCEWYGNALYVTSAEDHHKVVKMLLEAGAEVNT